MPRVVSRAELERRSSSGLASIPKQEASDIAIMVERLSELAGAIVQSGEQQQHAITSAANSQSNAILSMAGAIGTEKRAKTLRLRVVSRDQDGRIQDMEITERDE